MGDDPGFGPAKAGVEAFGGPAGAGIENEESFAGGEGRPFRMLHELGGDALAAGGAVNEQLGDFRPMRLVFRHGRDDLNGTDQRRTDKSGEQKAAALFEGGDDLAKEFLRSRTVERHETDGGTAIDAIKQDFSEIADQGTRVFGG